MWWIAKTLGRTAQQKYVAMEESLSRWTFRASPIPAAGGGFGGRVPARIPGKSASETLPSPASALVMLAAAIISWKTTPRPIHEATDFNFEPGGRSHGSFIRHLLTMYASAGPPGRR